MIPKYNITHVVENYGSKTNSTENFTIRNICNLMTTNCYGTVLSKTPRNRCMYVHLINVGMYACILLNY